MTNTWKNEDVKESLDLCLACKGCKGDCPVNVDMATYKAEFLSHYYEGRIRPRTAYVFGWIYWWARIASHMPSVVNFITHAPVLSTLAKAVAGIAPQRKLPKFAEVTFRDWFQKQPRKHDGKPKVILWTDTFNNFFLPETLAAGMDVLQAAGFEVIIPKQTLCCGRPLYDFGMLNTAKRMLLNIMDSLAHEIEQGTPIVGLEPSCVAVFRDELFALFPHDKRAQKLQKQVFTLAEFLIEKTPDFKIPNLKGKAIVHAHCHHNAIMKLDCDDDLLKKSGLDYTILNSGCCGMAGYFGYEKGPHYDVSVKSGERVLLPTVREAPARTIIIADGFSCREQIEQLTDRKALHLAQVLQMGLHKNDIMPDTPYPEKFSGKYKLRDPHRKMKQLVVAAFGLSVITVLILKKLKR